MFSRAASSSSGKALRLLPRHDGPAPGARGIGLGLGRGKRLSSTRADRRHASNGEAASWCSPARSRNFGLRCGLPFGVLPARREAGQPVSSAVSHQTRLKGLKPCTTDHQCMSSSSLSAPSRGGTRRHPQVTTGLPGKSVSTFWCRLRMSRQVRGSGAALAAPCFLPVSRIRSRNPARSVGAASRRQINQSPRERCITASYSRRVRPAKCWIERQALRALRESRRRLRLNRLGDQGPTAPDDLRFGLGGTSGFQRALHEPPVHTPHGPEGLPVLA